MASQWYCQVLGEQMGPMSWSDLVDLVGNGTVGESDLVRSDGQNAWEPAEKVVGLFRAARLAEGATGATPAESKTAQKPDSRVENPSGKTVKRRRSSQSAAAAAEVIAKSISTKEEDDDSQPTSVNRWFHIRTALVGLVAVAVVAVWWMNQDRRFPEHRLTAATGAIPTPPVLLHVPAPANPSAPNLIPEVATLLPGFEKVPNLFSPTLSADLKTIVFAHLADLVAGYDLYLATRSSVDEPFGPPKLIAGCQSTECDAYPALSPNLLELIFVRSDDKPQLMRSVRATVDAEFGAAEHCLAPSVIDADELVALPQFIDSGTLSFVRQRIDPPNRGFWLAARNPQGQFEPKLLMACTDPWPLWFVSANGLRAYSRAETGVIMAARQSTGHPFGQSVAWADVVQTGPVDGPLWVAPQEDVIVYSSAGPGKRLGDARKLWIWRKGANRESASAGRK